MAELQLRGVRKTFGGTTEVLRGIDLDIADGEFMVFVGPSGCGKSTLLRLIAGLEGTSDGEIRIGGERMDGVPPADRGVAMVFQSYALYPHMTVAENMGFALRIAGRRSSSAWSPSVVATCRTRLARSGPGTWRSLSPKPRFSSTLIVG